MTDHQDRRDRPSSATTSGPFQAVPTSERRKLDLVLGPFVQEAPGRPGGWNLTGAAVRDRELRLKLVGDGNNATVIVTPASPGTSHYLRVGGFHVGYLVSGSGQPSRHVLALTEAVGRALEEPGFASLVAALLAGPVQAGVQADFVFEPDGNLDDFSVPDCDHGPEEAPRRLGTGRVLVREGDNLSVFRSRADNSRGSPMVRAKSVLGRVRGPDGQLLEAVEPCRECAARFDCAVCFQAASGGPVEGIGPLAGALAASSRIVAIVGTDEFRDFVTSLAGEGGGEGPLVVVEAAGITDRESRARLAEHLREAGPGCEVLVVGRDPVARIRPVNDTLEPPVAPAEAPTTAAGLRDTVMGLVDYALTGRDGADPWFLRYGIGSCTRTVPVVRHATIVVNRKCVTICRYCDLPLRIRRNMTLQEAFRVIEEAGVLGVERMEFFGGEVTLRKDLFDLLAYARRLGMQTFVTTTGVGLDDDYLRELAACRVTDLSVSIDSAVPAVHDYLKNREGMHEAAVHAAVTLKRFGAPWVGLNSVIVSENYRQLPGVVELAADLGLQGAIFFFCQPVAEMGKRQEILSLGQARELLKEVLPSCRRIAAERGVSLGVRPALDMLSPGGDDQARLVSEATYCRILQTDDPCRVANELVSVDPVGDVRLCNQPLMQFGTDAVIGNINETPLSRILSSDAAMAFRVGAGRFRDCRHCTFDHEARTDE